MGACSAAPASLGTEPPSQLTCLAFSRSAQQLQKSKNDCDIQHEIVWSKFQNLQLLSIFSFNSKPLLGLSNHFSQFESFPDIKQSFLSIYNYNHHFSSFLDQSIKLRKKVVQVFFLQYLLRSLAGVLCPF